MTNEELKSGAEALAWHIRLSPFGLDLTDEQWKKLGFEAAFDNVIRTLVAQAYEEAAKIADSYERGRNGDPSDMIAGDIRAMKDSLVSVESSS
jgi:hypothetical protein